MYRYLIQKLKRKKDIFFQFFFYIFEGVSGSLAHLTIPLDTYSPLLHICIGKFYKHIDPHTLGSGGHETAYANQFFPEIWLHLILPITISSHRIIVRGSIRERKSIKRLLCKSVNNGGNRVGLLEKVHTVYFQVFS